MQYKKLTEKIIGCPYRVYNKMGYGFLESVLIAQSIGVERK